jgi:hypothetical protein
MAETPFSPDSEENGPSPQSPPTSSGGVSTDEPDTPGTSPVPDTAVEAIVAAPAAEATQEEPVLAPPEPVAEPLSVAEQLSEPEPGITATLEVPALEGSAGTAADGGGEFDLLLEKIRDWFSSGELQAQWQRFQGPLKGLAILIGVVLLLRVYASLIGTLDSLPLVGGLLELVGLITLTRFSLTRLVRRSDREQVFAEWGRRWKDFRGKD